MGREVRMVPPDWQHPTEWKQDWRTGKPDLRFRPLHDANYAERAAEWDEEAAAWANGLKRDYANNGWQSKGADDTETYSDYAGERPCEADYMPAFAPGTATHLTMYEDTSEGTPISPAFATPEELAHWLADNNASAFGGDGATYEQWLAMIKRGWAPSMIMVAHADGTREMGSGVAFMADRSASA